MKSEENERKGWSPYIAGAHEIMRYLRRRGTRHRRKVWQDGREEQFLMGYVSVQRFRLGRMPRPDYAMDSGEPSA